MGQGNESVNGGDTGHLEVGVALFEATGVSSFEAQDVTVASKLGEIAEFFGKHPDAVSTIRRVSRANQNPNVDRLDHMLSFVKLSKERMDAAGKLQKLEDELKFYG